MGCRFPGGANSPDEFWRMLLGKVDGVCEVPGSRWSIDGYYHLDAGEPGHMIARRGGFITQDVQAFDAAFFGMTPREAARMDPQQRLFLETTWEALEDAGIKPEELAQTPTAVFVGTSGHDHGIIQLNPLNRYDLDTHTMSGVTNCIIANRVSYLMDLRGPSVAVDTACSSSLVAVHLACQSVRSGESPLAIVGGVNLLINPSTTIGFSHGSFLSPDGRCKAFDSRANGYVRSEGAGVVILKLLSQAQADGDHVWAVIRGTASNQDGRTAGISLPSREAQERLLRDACTDANIAPSQIQYVEAHGTGTAAGDPIEASALGRALSDGRDADKPCIVGAVKTNIGHLESAAGIAGLVKACLVLKHKTIPGNLHFEQPNPSIPFKELKLRVAVDTEDYVAEGPRFAGVNSFGFGGANAHAILEEASSQPGSAPTQGAGAGSARSVVLPISAKSKAALNAYAARYIEQLESEALRPHDLSFSAARYKSSYDHRLAVVGSSAGELIGGLRSFLAGTSVESVKAAQKLPEMAAARKVFVFSGQGPQWWAMGRELFQAEPVFRDMIERCDEELSKHADWSLLDEFRKPEAESRIGETRVAQPAVFAVQVSLAALWRSWGIEPDAVIGHSIGEVAASYTCGALSFEDAVKVIFHRSRIQQQAAGKGAMLAIGMPQAEAQALVSGYPGKVFIGAVNGLQSVALSGDPEPLNEIAAKLSEQQIFAQLLHVNVAFHSHHMDPLEAQVRSSLGGIQSRPPRIPMYSTVTGKRIGAQELTADYWWRNIREPVLFAPTVATQLEDGHQVFIELGPHPIHTSSISELMSRSKTKGLVVSSLIRRKPERDAMLRSAAELFVAGIPVDLAATVDASAKRMSLPMYPWQRERHWSESDASRATRHPPLGHPLRGRYIPPSDEPNRHVWEVELDDRRITWMKDHCVQGPIVFPAAGYVDMTLGCFSEIYGDAAFCLEDIQFRKALFVYEDQPPLTLQLVLRPDKTFALHARQPDQTEWSLHVTGQVSLQVPDNTERVDLAELRRVCDQEITPDDMYRRNEKNGLQLGPTFKPITGLWRTEGKSLTRMATPDMVQGSAARHCIFPGILDSGIQALSVTMDVKADLKTIYLPVNIARVTYYGKPDREVWSYGQMAPQADPDYGEGSFVIFNDDGKPVIRWEGFRSKALNLQKDERRAIMQWVYDFTWVRRLSRTARRLTADFLPPVPEIETAMQPVTDELRVSAINREYHDVAAPKINQLCVDYLTEAFHELGYRFEPGARFTTEEAIAQLGVAPPRVRYFGRVLSILANYGILEKEAGVWTVKRIPDRRNTAQGMETLRAKHPGFATEYKILERCGLQQAGILNGKVDPVELIFKESEYSGVADLYDNSFSATKCNKLARGALRRMLADLPADRPFRVLEIGAGTGGTTAHLLPELPADRAEYTYTDIGQLFLGKAKERFREYDFVEYRELDIEKDIEAQGFRPHYYDLVVASNVLHATPDLTETFNAVKQLMTAGGYLLVIEAVYPPPHWVDLTFGTTEGWWKCNDPALRPDYPLLTENRWRAFLKSLGFAGSALLTDTRDETESGNPVIIAQMPDIALPQEDDVVPEGAWIVLDDEQGVGRRFIQDLGARGAGSVLVRRGNAYRRIGDHEVVVDPTSVDDLARVLGDVARSAHRCAGLLHLWNLDFTSMQPTAAQLKEAEQVGCFSAVALLQAYGKTEWNSRPRLWIGTRGAHSIAPLSGKPVPVSILQTPSWGMLRVLVCEQADVPAKIIDLDPNGTPAADSSALIQEYTTGSRNEEEVGFRDGQRYVHRLGRVSYDALKASANESVHAAATPFRLPLREGGDLRNLQYERAERVAPQEGEVEIRIQATALNFRDVMLALGLLAESATLGGYYGPNLGVECSGEVTRVGAGVTHVRVGDRVCAFAVGCFGSHVTTRAQYAMPIPDKMSMSEGTTLPMAFLTAYQALVNVGRVRAGDRVLIHAGAGGVGLAAIQIALKAGAQVYATAGKPEKRDYLKSLGVSEVFDSRSLEFADKLRAATRDDSAGAGVDLVLNSLGGEFIPLSLGLLRPGGRFVEIGKQDIHDNYKLGLKPFERNLSYAAVDIDRLLLENPALCAEMFAQVMNRVRDGAFRPLPQTTFHAADIESAFRYMSGGKHTGKVVVTFSDDEAISVAPPASTQTLFREDGTYLVTGGVSGFGLRSAQWMVERGARTVVLASRRGVVSAEEQPALEQMRARGAHVILEKADCSDEAAVKALLARMRTLPPLRGVYHAAMVLEDTPLAIMGGEQFLNVVAPKMDGAWNLHKLTLDHPIEQFVLYSSMSYVVGTPGQGNYAAANAFLDALAKHRHALGLPALTVNWGVISDVGYVARTKIDTLARLGWRPVTPERAFHVIEECLTYKAATASVFSIDWIKMASIIPVVNNTERFRQLIAQESGSGTSQRSSSSILEELRGLAEEDATRVIQTALAQQIAKVFDMPAEQLDTTVSLTNLGMDSLMAGQIRNWIATELGTDFPTMGLMRGPTIVQLAGELRALVSGEKVQATEDQESAGGTPTNPWVHWPRLNSENATMRVLTFPFVGGGATVFNSWPDDMGSAFEIMAVQYPGRGNRVDETPIDDMPTLVKAIAENILPYLDRGFAIYGHCMGSLIAYEVAHYLQTHFDETPLKLVIAGWPAPPLVQKYVEGLEGIEGNYMLENVTDDDVLNVLTRNRLIAPELVADRQRMAPLMPGMRAELKMLGLYRHTARERLRCPVTCLLGTEDSLFNAAQLRSWRDVTSGAFSFVQVPGEHLFIKGKDRRPIETIRRELEERTLPSFSPVEASEPSGDLVAQ
ncbi:MAG: SDR family NAD(P)-dependent oxidoreductase [Ramlibacter sp.]|nr:SDR family NAD(P)-dependent oxidoreductase [Ramlibacter sp.]